MQAESLRPSAGDSLIDTVADWLMAQALVPDAGLDALVSGCCTRLAAAGIPLWRGHVAFRTLHPLFEAMAHTWQRDAGVKTVGFRHGTGGASDRFRESAHYHMIENRIPLLRRRLVGEEAVLDFPALKEFRDDGATDYLAYIVAFNEAGTDGIIGSWMTDRPAAFSERDIRSLLRIQSRLAVACKVIIKEQIAENIVTTYLGRNTGRRVLAGRIKRGDRESIHAVVWYSDLRGSTQLADLLEPDAYLAALNAYFECTAGAVMEAGGEVLLLIGDAVLAIFPIGDGGASEPEACEAALGAARQAQTRLDRTNEARRGVPALDFGVGLHVGDVMYGNIGVPERLQFTVVGPVANEVARLQGLTKVLDRRVLVSGAFAQNLPLQWTSMGAHELQGVSAPLEVFAPPVADASARAARVA